MTHSMIHVTIRSITRSMSCWIAHSKMTEKLRSPITRRPTATERMRLTLAAR